MGSRREAAVVWLGVALHVLACVTLLLVAPGTEANADLSDRLRWIAAHERLWQANWVAWMGASSSLLAIVVIWSQRLRRRRVPGSLWLVPCVIVAVGLASDLAGEITLIRITAEPAEMAASLRLYQILSPGIANGLYCLGGLWLSILSWRAAWLRGPWAIVGFTMWITGLALTLATVAALAGYDSGRQLMVFTGGGVMALFVPWASYIGWRVLRESS